MRNKLPKRTTQFPANIKFLVAYSGGVERFSARIAEAIAPGQRFRGPSHFTIEDWVKDKTEPRLGYVIAVCNAFNINIDKLVHGTITERN